ncbi:hypothetical protein E2P81_ATG00106 [Venturia nashicola]|uniref:Uncharacterized protein n=1 Tax=Venturia nashicola TaxID=86259 RepID=A0A4Z1PFI6_9PEZI|nr:hypothetical protein E6O75_ATG00113 [Venturia nashicola]TLD39119.1 hypothetical protein E2P81_ATG00106 [Venturia nashicola]
MDRKKLVMTAILCMMLYALKDETRREKAQSKRDRKINQRLESQTMVLFSELSEQTEDAKLKRAFTSCSDDIWDEAPDTVLKKGYLECVDSIASYLGVSGPRLSVTYDRIADHDEESMKEDNEGYYSETLQASPPKKRRQHERHDSDEDADDESSVAESDDLKFASRPLKKLRLLRTRT